VFHNANSHALNTEQKDVNKKDTFFMPLDTNTLNSSIFSEKFINLLMIDGKKIKAYNLFFKMLEILNEKTGKQNKKNFELTDAIQRIDRNDFSTNTSTPIVVEHAIINCMPSVEVRKVRVAGTTYLVPAMIPKKKQEALAMRWIIEAAKKKKKTSKLSFAQCLAEEIFDAFLKQGYARTKRNEFHRLAEVNRAYIRYRWW
jgi:small subunit ribosomal protein S7